MLKKLEELITNSNQYYAHISEVRKPESLQEHLDRTMFYYNEICQKKQMRKHIKEIIHFTVELNVQEEEFVYELFEAAIYYHDIGKINPNFQKRKMKQTINYIETQSTTEHSSLSALLYIAMYEPKLKQFVHLKELKIFLYTFAYIIARHHTYLENLNGESFLEKLEDMKQSDLYECFQLKDTVKTLDFEMNIFAKFAGILQKKKFAQIEFYLLAKMLYALLVACDYYATHEYQNGEKVEIKTIGNKEKFIEKYHKTEVYQSIRQYRENSKTVEISKMNELRTEIFLEAEKNIKEKKESSIFYLEAPTGSGKTNTSLNLALTLLEQDNTLNNIFYIFPFNTLIEQTKETFEQIFEYETDFMVVNSQTAITTSEEKMNYEQIFLDYQFMHYPIILTSHVNLFSAFFGTSREGHLWLSRFANSVIILDEIQSYKNKIWPKMIAFLKRYAELLNIKIIMMSATLPQLDELLEEKENVTELLPNKAEYFKNDQFRQRVEIDTSLLKKGKISLEEVKEFVLKLPKQKILIEFFEKRTAREFWKLVKLEAQREIVLLTGDNNCHIRKILLKKIKENDNVIVICTQVIEAGVDIDMDIGLKDISLIDSEEQFLGRINRSCKKKGCKAYFFQHGEANKIYKEDIRTQFSIQDIKFEQILKDKNFREYYSSVLRKLKEQGEENNRNNIASFWNQVRSLAFSEVEKEMKLIDEQKRTLFLNYPIEEQDINGKEIWEEYKELCNNMQMPYAEKQIKLSILKEKMEWFLYQIPLYQKNLYADEEFGGILYIEHGENYMEEDLLRAIF